MPEDYTTRELGLLLNDVKGLITANNEQNTKEHSEIKNRLDYTNGKVRNLRIWRAYLTGGIAVLAFIVSVFGTICLAR